MRQRRSLRWILASGAIFSSFGNAPLLTGPRVLAAEPTLAVADDGAHTAPTATSTGATDEPTTAAAADPLYAVDDVPAPFRYAHARGFQPYSRPDSGLGGLTSPIETPTTDPDAPSSPLEGLLRDIPSAPPAAEPARDTTLAITESSSTDTVRAQRRSPVAFDPRIRGFRQGQIYAQADGAYWLPAREDLDSMLSKIPPTAITGIHVFSGPYSVRYGPGFAFIDIVTADTPRYDCGSELHNTLGLIYRTNGNQWYGYETVEGGGANYGFRLGYGNRNGIDYEAGNGERIPSSYLNQDFIAQFGYDINPFQHLEFRFNHLIQTDTEYFGKFFDMDALVVDGFNLRLVDEDPAGPWSRFVVEGWYNRTDFHGDTDSPYTNNGKSQTIDRVEQALLRALSGNEPIFFFGDTNGFVASTGARAAVTFGDDDEANLTLGADVRYITQEINENYDITSTGTNLSELQAGQLDNFGTNQPWGNAINPGAFAELAFPWRSYWKTTVGARLDWLHTDIREEFIRSDTSLPAGDMARNNSLYAFFLNNIVDLDEYWSVDAGFGHAQRPPTLTERYADGVFLALFQNGFTRVVGDPFLHPERAWQIDVGLRGDYGDVRGGVRGFYTWVLDYATYDVAQVAPPGGPLGAQLAHSTSTDLATLAGFELDGAIDWNDYLTLFGNLSYIEGRDQIIDAPLFGIYPLEGRVGLRLHDPAEENRWGIEFFGRIVDDQDRLGALRSGPFVVPVEKPTPGFTVWNLRAYWAATRNIRLTGGIENVFDRNYLEHLDLRLDADTAATPPIPELRLLAPGITPYVGMEWTF